MRPPLDGSQALELADFLSQPDLLRYEAAHGLWHAHITYARRAAIALTSNDLELAIRCAKISTHALYLHTDHGTTAGPGTRRARL